jgi:hypothetical protein
MVLRGLNSKVPIKKFWIRQMYLQERYSDSMSNQRGYQKVGWPKYNWK